MSSKGERSSMRTLPSVQALTLACGSPVAVRMRRMAVVANSWKAISSRAKRACASAACA
jgi:hypothetical protein